MPGDVDAHRLVRVVEQEVGYGLVHGHRQETVLQRVAAEDVGEAAADDRAEAEIQQGPGRVLARGATAEVAAGYQHLLAGGVALAQRVADLLAAVLVEAPAVETVLVDGKVVVENKKLVNVDEEEIQAKVVEETTKLWKKSGYLCCK